MEVRMMMLGICITCKLWIICALVHEARSYGYNQSLFTTYRARVKEMFEHAYDSYMRHAYPLDELQPLTCDGADTWGSFSLSLVDALDTLLVMGNVTEYQKAYNLLIQHPSFNIDVNTSVFEANIRVVGGLLSAHFLSPMGGVPLAPGWPCEGPLLNMAESLARRLLPAFATPTGLPYGTINLRYGVPIKETPVTCTACCSSFLVEFGSLTRLTGDPIFEETALKAVRAIWDRRSDIGLPGNHINVVTGQWTAGEFSVGNYVDSYLEYLVKGAALFGHRELKVMFDELLDSIVKHTNQQNWYVWVDKKSGKMTLPYFEALDAYWPGLLSLVGELRLARSTHLSHYMVWKSLGGLPEILNIIDGAPVKKYEAYHLRPELAESAWYLYQATGNPLLVQVGRSMVDAISKIARVKCGFATVRNVMDHTLTNRMESYFLAETLKYLYLLFDPDNFVSTKPRTKSALADIITKSNAPHLLYNKKLLEDGCSVGRSGYILNTEAHPVDVGALHCCRHKWTGEEMESEGIIPSIHGCRARSFSSRLELFTADVGK